MDPGYEARTYRRSEGDDLWIVPSRPCGQINAKSPYFTVSEYRAGASLSDLTLKGRSSTGRL